MGRKQYKEYLFLRYKLIGRYTGYLFYVISIITAMPLLLILFYPQEASKAVWFAIPSISIAIAGFILRRQTSETGVINLAEGAVIVVAAWLAAILCGAVPFLFAGYGLTSAVFESTSGWTTTGLSVLDISNAGRLILFFRSILQFAGGAGLAILLLSIMTGTSGTGLSAAEGHSEQLIPNVRQSARLVMILYTSYAAAGILMLYLAGMDMFDAICHSFSALSTGGFSTHTQSAAYWNSATVESVLILLMIAGSTNFMTAYTFFQGKITDAAANCEVRLALILIPLFSALIYLTSGSGMRESLFKTVTALSTTGFSISQYSGCDSLNMIVMLLMIFGGGTGSTAGGIKLFRIYLLIKGVKNGIREALLPEIALTQETMVTGTHRYMLTDRHFYTAYRYIALYLLTWLIGGLIISMKGYPIANSLYEFASALGTVGLTSGITSADAPKAVLWTETAGMLLGRLEFFVIFWGIFKFLSDTKAILSDRKADGL